MFIITCKNPFFFYLLSVLIYPSIRQYIVFLHIFNLCFIWNVLHFTLKHIKVSSDALSLWLLFFLFLFFFLFFFFWYDKNESDLDRRWRSQAKVKSLKKWANGHNLQNITLTDITAFLTLTQGQGHNSRSKVTYVEVSAFSECFLFCFFFCFFFFNFLLKFEKKVQGRRRGVWAIELVGKPQIINQLIP